MYFSMLDLFRKAIFFTKNTIIWCCFEKLSPFLLMIDSWISLVPEALNDRRCRQLHWNNHLFLRSCFLLWWRCCGLGSFMRIISCLHPCHIALANRLVFHNWFGIILADDNSTLLLDCKRCIPWFINIFCRKVFELRQPFSYVLSIFVSLLSECNGAITPEILVKMRRAW